MPEETPTRCLGVPQGPAGLKDGGSESASPSFGLSFHTVTSPRATILFWQRVCRRDHGVGLKIDALFTEWLVLASPG